MKNFRNLLLSSLAPSTSPQMERRSRPGSQPPNPSPPLPNPALLRQSPALPSLQPFPQPCASTAEACAETPAAATIARHREVLRLQVRCVAGGSPRHGLAGGPLAASAPSRQRSLRLAFADTPAANLDLDSAPKTTGNLDAKHRPEVRSALRTPGAHHPLPRGGRQRHHQRPSSAMDVHAPRRHRPSPNHRPRGTLAITIAASTAWAPAITNVVLVQINRRGAGTSARRPLDRAAGAEARDSRG